MLIIGLVDKSDGMKDGWNIFLNGAKKEPMCGGIMNRTEGRG